MSWFNRYQDLSADNRCIIGCNVLSVLSQCGINDVSRIERITACDLLRIRQSLAECYDVDDNMKWRVGFILDLINPLCALRNDPVIYSALLDYLCCF